MLLIKKQKDPPKRVFFCWGARGAVITSRPRQRPQGRQRQALQPAPAQREPGRSRPGCSCDRRRMRGGRVATEWNFTTSGTISSATMLMILISGLTAGPAVSL
jgi:hypothetical protein